jgi:hypothetical protein
VVKETVYDDKTGAPVSSKMRTKLGPKHVPEVLASFAPEEGIVFEDTVKVHAHTHPYLILPSEARVV